MNSAIQNPGSALGEAIGAEMERALNRYLHDLVTEHGYHFLSQSPIRHKTGKPRKLLMYDRFGTAYNIDAVIVNESTQPIILVESKYIRYKKHNRDKGSWVCTAHPAIRRHYHSIRSSIAVLAGNWSSSSLAMMKSYDINIFLIPFRLICGLLEQHGIDFNWDEKDRATAANSWARYSALTEEERAIIGLEMINFIRADLGQLVLSILDETLEREIDKVLIELRSNLGEVKGCEFGRVEDAIDFLNTAELKQVFITTDSLTLFDSPSKFSGEETEAGI
jgi:hypothetical protein